MIQRIVTDRVREDEIERVEAAIRDLIAGIRASEPGTIAYRATSASTTASVSSTR